MVVMAPPMTNAETQKHYRLRKKENVSYKDKMRGEEACQIQNTWIETLKI